MPVGPLSHASPFPAGLVVVGIVTVGLVVLAVALESRLSSADEANAVDVGGILGPIDGVNVDAETGAATLPDGTDLDPAEARGVAAVYDYLGRRPGATQEEVRRRVHPAHPAGHDDPGEWWDDLVDPALSALTGTDATGGSADEDGRGLTGTTGSEPPREPE